MKYFIAASYPTRPKPEIMPVHTSLKNLFFLKSSLDRILLMCTSIAGVSTDAIASLNATDVWVNPPAFIIIPSYLNPIS